MGGDALPYCGEIAARNKAQIDVIRAWMPCIARRIGKLPEVASELDMELVADTETIAWKYWRRMVTG